ncbi:hypothetical protein [Halostella sp. PRR32]|uniref:hypothetical protein n=1 Tax=Halostella sp. PRR32 TaxID=3098147 RepID=UPI002B1E36B6|nr:hypothetical protein [Halostella sp. PRR32]
MGDDTENGNGETGDDADEEQDVNQYGGGDQDIDAVEQTERREDDVETEEDSEEEEPKEGGDESAE